MPSNSGHPRERLVAAAYAQSGYFVERNRWLDPDRALEIDVLATRLAPKVDRLLVGVTKSTKKERSPGRDGDVVHSRWRLLGLDRGVSVTKRSAHGGHARRLQAMSTRIFAVENDEDIVERLATAGECPGATAPWAELWVGAFEVVDVLRATVRDLPASADEATRTLGAEIKQRWQQLETDLWIREDQMVRARALRRLEIGQSRNLTQRAADHWHPYGEYRYRAFEAFRKAELLPVHAALQVQLVERLLLTRTIVELAMAASTDPALRSQLDQEFFVGTRITAAIDQLDVAVYLPAILQAFFFVLGGFIWTRGRDREMEILGQIAGCDAQTAETALDDLFPRILPFSGQKASWWWKPSRGSTVEGHKFFPTPLHGAGVVARNLIHAGNADWHEMWAPSDWKAAFNYVRSQLRDPEGVAPRRDQRTRPELLKRCVLRCTRVPGALRPSSTPAGSSP